MQNKYSIDQKINLCLKKNQAKIYFLIQDLSELKVAVPHEKYLIY